MNFVIGFIIASLAIGSIGGYKVRDWQANNDENEALSSELHAIHEHLASLGVVNEDTNAKQRALLEKQTATNKAIEGVKREIKTKPVGGCSLTPDADSLRQQAHQATAGSLSK